MGDISKVNLVGEEAEGRGEKMRFLGIWPCVT